MADHFRAQLRVQIGREPTDPELIQYLQYLTEESKARKAASKAERRRLDRSPNAAPSSSSSKLPSTRRRPPVALPPIPSFPGGPSSPTPSRSLFNPRPPISSWKFVLTTYLTISLAVCYFAMPPQRPSWTSVINDITNALVQLDDTVKGFSGAQRVLAVHQTTYCHAWEAACQLYPSPQSASFFTDAQAAWRNVDDPLRWCPRPPSCDDKSQHIAPSTVEWRERTGAALTNVTRVVGQIILTTDEMLRQLRDATAELSHYATIMSHNALALTNPPVKFVTATPIARICRFSFSSHYLLLDTIFLGPACLVIHELIGIHHILAASALFPPSGQRYAPSAQDLHIMSTTSSFFCYKLDSTLAATIASLETLHNLGSQACRPALDTLDAVVGIHTTASSQRLHRNLLSACKVFPQASKFSPLTRTLQQLRQLREYVSYRILLPAAASPGPLLLHSQPFILWLGPWYRSVGAIIYDDADVFRFLNVCTKMSEEASWTVALDSKLVAGRMAKALQWNNTVLELD